MATFEEIKALKKKHSASLLKKPGVCGVDIDVNDAGQASLTVHLDTADASAREQLPKELDGFPLNYVHTGPFRKQ